jgi:peptide/nickel transport system substrate-binding protein
MILLLKMLNAIARPAVFLSVLGTSALTVIAGTEARGPHFTYGAETLSFSMDMPVLTLDPLSAMDASSQRFLNLTHGALVVRGEGLAMEPDLAESWKVLPRGDGGKVKGQDLLFRLRPHLKFEDGTALTAADVVQSLNRFFQTSRMASQFKIITAVEARGEREILIRTASTVPPSLIQDLYLAKIYRLERGTTIAAGRYRLTAQGPSLWVIERNLHHWEPPSPGAPRTIRLSHTRDDTTRYQMFLRGDLDLIQSALSISKTDHLRDLALPWTWIEDSPGIGAQYIAFNFRNPILKDHRVRQAIAQAFNRDALANHRFRRYVTLDDTILNPWLTDYAPGLPHPLFDPTAAEKLLDEAGFPRGADGVRFTLDMKLIPVKETMDISRVFAADLERVGIRLRLRVAEGARFFDDLKNGRFDLFTSRWASITEPYILYRAFHSSQSKDFNRGAYANPEVDRLLEAKEYKEVQALLAKDLPYIFMWRWGHTVIATKKIRPFKPMANGDLIILSKVLKGE